MLVLTRHVGETIRIGPDIYVTLIRTSRGVCRLGITAPRDMPIDRIDDRDFLSAPPHPPAPAEACCDSVGDDENESDIPDIGHEVGGEGGGHS